MTITDYIDASPCPAWAAENAAQFLMRVGFKDVTAASEELPQKFFIRPYPGMLLAAKLPSQMHADALSFRIIGAHTDSPHLRLKSNAVVNKAEHSVLASEIYGGALLYTWFDRPLGLAGEIYYTGRAAIEKKLIRIDRAIATVPSLAIHLQRGVNDDGFKIDKAKHLTALIALDEKFDFKRFLANEAQIAPEALLSYDLSLFDTARATRGGFGEKLLSSARLDNLVSCYAALTALTQCENSNAVSMIALFDHEEIGSVSEAGAESAQLTSFMTFIVDALKIPRRHLQNIYARSYFLSADMAHGVHPNYAEKHDDLNRPHLGGGVTLKINHNRRYATSAACEAFFVDLCRKHAIRSQTYTHRNDLPCGSTIGPTASARLGLPVFDVGIAMLAMHSIRETCAAADISALENFCRVYLTV